MTMAAPQANVTPFTPRVVEEETAWTRFMDELAGRECWLLIDVSRTNTDQRVYRVQDRILKVLKQALGDHPTGGLAPEASVFADLASAGQTQYGGVSFQQIDRWQVLSMPRYEGQRLDESWAVANLRQRLRVARRVFSAVTQVNRQGVSHRDLRASNVLVDAAQNVTLVDFGQARKISWPRSSINDLVGLPHSSVGPEVTLSKSLMKIVAPWMARPVSLARSTLMAGLRPPQVRNVPATFGESHPDPEIALLAHAWQLGSMSDATAEGQAYYSLNIESYHLPGERPWPLRWDMIRRNVSFKDKHFLELGCNLGLLASHALLNGAASARGVDMNPTIIEGARNVAKAWDVNPEFAVLNVDEPEPWEQRYAGADIVSALSLYNWISQKSRLLTFLGAHKEVLYEGHDSLPVECNRLRSVGFETVTILGETERNRWLLHAKK